MFAMATSAGEWFGQRSGNAGPIGKVAAGGRAANSGRLGDSRGGRGGKVHWNVLPGVLGRLGRLLSVLLVAAVAEWKRRPNVPMVWYSTSGPEALVPCIRQ